MSFFEPATTVTESPEPGQEEVVAAEEQETQEQAQEPTREVEAGVDEAQTEEQTPSQEEQGTEQSFDYEKSYRELRRDYTRKAQELAEMKRQAQPPAQPEQGKPADMEAVTNQFWEEFQRDPVNTLYRFADSVASQRVQTYQQQVEQMIGPIYENQAAQAYAKNMDTLAKTYPELRTGEGHQQLNQKVQEISQEMGNPNLAYNPSKRILDLAAREAFGDSGAKLYQKAKAKGAEEALNTIRTKQGLSAPGGAKLKEQPKSFEDQIAENIVNAGRRGGIFG